MRLDIRHERILIVLISLHSMIVGAMLFFAPQWAMQFAGWDRIEPEFFGIQAGVFHFVLATGYILEFSRYRGVLLLVTAKTIAFIFLTGVTLLDPLPWAVWVSGILDGAMAVMVFWVHRTVAVGRGPTAGR